MQINMYLNVCSRVSLFAQVLVVYYRDKLQYSYMDSEAEEHLRGPGEDKEKSEKEDALVVLHLLEEWKKKRAQAV